MKINEMFYIDEIGRLVKSSNDETNPSDEPVFILRGRDALAYETICTYIHLCQNSDPPVPEYRLAQLHGVAERFFTFPGTRLKTPGISRAR